MRKILLLNNVGQGIFHSHFGKTINFLDKMLKKKKAKKNRKKNRIKRKKKIADKSYERELWKNERKKQGREFNARTQK